MLTEKVSVTLDRELLTKARRQVGRRELSRAVNEALSDWLHWRGVERMLAGMDAEAGPVPEEARREWRGG